MKKNAGPKQRPVARSRLSSSRMKTMANVAAVLAAAVEIAGGRVNVDFAGSDAASRWGINVPIIYTKAYASYALKCVVAPDIPNNWASLEPFTVASPVNILNAERPAPVSVRHVIGHLVPDLVLGALAQALPGSGRRGGGAVEHPHVGPPGCRWRGTAGRDPDVQLGRHGRAPRS